MPGNSIHAARGILFLTAMPLFSSLGWGYRAGYHINILSMLQLAAFSLPALLQKMVLAAHSITQDPPSAPALPKTWRLVGVLLTLPCTAQYLLCAHVSLHPARMDGHTQDPLVLEFHSQAPRHHVLGSLEEAQPCQHNWGSGWAGEGTFLIYKMSIEMGNGT